MHYKKQIFHTISHVKQARWCIMLIRTKIIELIKDLKGQLDQMVPHACLCGPVYIIKRQIYCTLFLFMTRRAVTDPKKFHPHLEATQLVVKNIYTYEYKTVVSFRKVGMTLSTTSTIFFIKERMNNI
jgi:hypothetical protein